MGQLSDVPVPDPTDEVEVMNRMKIRRSPRFFVEMMELLNENRQWAVREMGCGHLIHFNITSIPLQLAYWLLYSFDSLTCSVKVSGQSLHLMEEDVYMTMGLHLPCRRPPESHCHVDVHLLSGLYGLSPSHCKLWNQSCIEASKLAATVSK